MSLIDFIMALQQNEIFEAYSNAGIFNVETGKASFRTEFLRPCDCGIETHLKLQYECSRCGKTKTNNLTLQSGDGDGLYTVVTLMNRDSEVFASLTLFDFDSTLASQFIEAIENENIREFDSLTHIYQWNSLGVRLGSLTLNESNSVLYSDATGAMDSAKAQVSVDDWVSGGITVYGFVRDSVEGEMAQTAIAAGSAEENFTGGLYEAQRPRIVLLLSDSVKGMADAIVDLDLSGSDWANQIYAWSKQVTASHVSDQSMKAIYMNALIENAFGSFALENNRENAVDYFFKEFSWYLQGALFGDGDCSEGSQAMLEESEGELDDPETLSDAYRLRGLWSKAQSIFKV